MQYERRHRNDVPYALPKDLMEGERLNLQHYLFRYALKGNYAAPLTQDTVHEILDVGSGTGIWVQEMAREFPEARISAIDLEPPQSVSLSSTIKPLPSNCQFFEGNILNGLPFPDDAFDFTHQRMLALALPADQWPKIINELIRVTRPGGWVELLEIGATIGNGGPASIQLVDWARNFLRTRGIDPRLMENLGALVTQQGLKDVHTRYLDLPVGSWDKRIGVLLEKDCLAAYRALKEGVCANLNVSPFLYDQVLETAPQEWSSHRATYRFTLIYGKVV